MIRIDHYQRWRRLGNAARDASGALALFQKLGFELAAAPLLDDRATGSALWSLVRDDLKTLGEHDSLVLFYAGHGATEKHHLGPDVIKTGYLIPVDAQDKVYAVISDVLANEPAASSSGASQPPRSSSSPSPQSRCTCCTTRACKASALQRLQRRLAEKAKSRAGGSAGSRWVGERELRASGGTRPGPTSPAG